MFTLSTSKRCTRSIMPISFRSGSEVDVDVGKVASGEDFYLRASSGDGNDGNADCVMTLSLSTSPEIQFYALYFLFLVLVLSLLYSVYRLISLIIVRLNMHSGSIEDETEEKDRTETNKLYVLFQIYRWTITTWSCFLVFLSVIRLNDNDKDELKTESDRKVFAEVELSRSMCIVFIGIFALFILDIVRYVFNVNYISKRLNPALKQKLLGKSVPSEKDETKPGKFFYEDDDILLENGCCVVLDTKNLVAYCNNDYRVYKNEKLNTIVEETEDDLINEVQQASILRKTLNISPQI